MYLHGTYGELKTPSLNSGESKSVVVYVGTAPIHKVAGGSTNTDLVNKPLKITGLTSARKLLGYSEKAPFDKYTLCEAVEAHFNNSVENVGPIYVINVFNPAATGAVVPTTTPAEYPVVKKVATFTLGDLVYDSITIEDLDDADYTLSYDSQTDTVTVVVTATTVPTKIKVSGNAVKMDTVTSEDIIGGKDATTGEKTGLAAIEDIYRMYNEIVNVIAAPGFSETPAVYEAMIDTATKLNGHWDAFVNADIPTTTTVKTIANAIDWKKDNGYDYGNSKVFWPKALRKDGKVFHLSTLATAKMLELDASNDGVPFVSVSNKEVDAADQTGATGFHGFDLDEGNLLNEEGITTLVKWGGKYRLWGPHTAHYTYADEEAGTQDPRYQFDNSIRTLFHITNAFQKDNFNDIDQPMTTHLKDTIVMREQSKLDTLVAMGALIGDARVSFSEENDMDGVMNGNFIWDIQTTTTVPFKSGIVKVGYTPDGLSVLLGGDE